MTEFEIVIAVDVPLYKELTVRAESREDAVALVQNRIDADEFSDEEISDAICAYPPLESGWEVGYPDDVEVGIVHIRAVGVPGGPSS